ncbi:Transcriptional regulator, TetR family [Cystobacter fuscus DSM 2262]|uniref:Transcriptional regulator, TetR family n=1 Tax=Cystobacter fuscus (strain ATCC 25194 / DSM 2262 / NBRC 100088 / M29) TaxID=1242864 RepID=S9Q7H6_CYSF2|nr:TetR/AcrR family transcriptional regulator [Cystobacter fuscus]EPX57279.1 Transcriptional regulator, TetR family [Cystobacter fuscus DSM 2262]
MEVFWERGYEGTSITDLTEAMGITTPSLYGAFTSKAELYREALELYQRTHGSPGAPALVEEPTARGAMARVLEEAARAFADPRHPPGCMVSTAVLNCATENQPVARYVAGLRDASLAQLRARFQRAIAEGELPSSTDAEGLARFYGAILQGMSVQARDGASEEELRKIVTLALSRFPRR